MMSDKMKTKEKGSPNTVEKKNAFIKKKSESTLAKEKKKILANVHRLNRLKEKDHKINIRMDEELRNKENQAKRSLDYSRNKRASSEKRAK